MATKAPRPIEKPPVEEPIEPPPKPPRERDPREPLVAVRVREPHERVDRIDPREVSFNEVKKPIRYRRDKQLCYFKERVPVELPEKYHKYVQDYLLSQITKMGCYGISQSYTIINTNGIEYKVHSAKGFLNVDTETLHTSTL